MTQNAGSPVVLSAAESEYFRIFGFLKVPGLMGDGIDEITTAFDELFATSDDIQRLARDDRLHRPTGPDRDVPRLSLTRVHERHPVLQAASEDPRVTTAAEQLLGGPVELNNSNANIFACDVSWHPDDIFVQPTEGHVKVFLYLDEVTPDTGAIRIVPMSYDQTSESARALRDQMLARMFRPDAPVPADVPLVGVPQIEIPFWSCHSTPGDAIFVDVRSLHASFGGDAHRRLLALGFNRADQAAG
jgi:ectoine hydroxylase-related dioxygenase (phytanoyl-CoA dioxygenase family)